jgi:hypothetical protein
MRKHCSNVCEFRPCLATGINKLGTQAHYHDRSAAAAIFANGTYFLDNPRTMPLWQQQVMKFQYKQ